MARKARQQACKAAGHVLPALGKQRDEHGARLSPFKWGFPPQLASLETPTVTPTEVCLPGDSKSNLADSEDGPSHQQREEFVQEKGHCGQSAEDKECPLALALVSVPKSGDRKEERY